MHSTESILPRWTARRIATVVALLLAAPFVARGAGTDPVRPPIEVFVRNPDIRQAQLSPSGRWLAITTANKQNRMFLAVIDLQGDRESGKSIASYADADVRSFDWVNDDRLVFNIVDLEAPGADQDFGPGLFSVKRDGSELRMLIRPRADFVRASSIASVQPLAPNNALISVLRDGSDDVIVGEYKYNAGYDLESVAAKRLDTATGRAVSISSGAPAHARGWLVDGHGEPRVVATEFEGHHELFWRAPGKTEWTSISKGSGAAARVTPVAVDGQGVLYVLSPSKSGMHVFRRFDVASGKPDADPILSAPGFDIAAQPVIERDTSRLLGVRYETDAGATVWFDPDIKALQDEADKRYPGRVNQLTCRRCTTDGVALVYSYSDQDPGSFFLYRATTRRWESLGRRRSDVDPRAMAQLDLQRIKARDGEDLPVWITAPAVKVEGPRPAVVLLHGGPWARGTRWQWNGEAQFLASRGYLVIEPEFRGSTGYGHAHLVKGFKQWGLKMQDDVADAVLWAEGKGLVDPKRVCLMGASYGGYATLMGLVRQPELYRCGVAWLAVTDPRLLFENTTLTDISREAQEYSLPQRVGDPVRDAALLKDAAPIEHAAEIKAPLLMAFGGNDVRVPIKHGRTMRAALRDAGHDPEYVVYDGEGHGFLKLENRVDFYRRVEAFLAKNLQ